MLVSQDVLVVLSQLTTFMMAPLKSVLRCEATLVKISSSGRSVSFRREDTGDFVEATMRLSERRAWVRESPFHLGGWRLYRNIIVALAGDAPKQKGPTHDRSTR